MPALSFQVFVHGKGVKIALSRLAMEVVLSPCVVFFWEAHERIGDMHLDRYFGQYGQIYRAAQVRRINYCNPAYAYNPPDVVSLPSYFFASVPPPK